MSNESCAEPKEKISYGAYFFGQNMIYTLVAGYLMVYYTDYVLLPPLAISIIFLVSKIWDAINDPLFGIIVDRTHLRGGKFLPWIRISTILLPAVSALLFFLPAGWPVAARVAYAAVSYLIWGMLYTVCDVPLFALSTAITEKTQERSMLISYGRLAAGAAMVLVSTLFISAVGKVGFPLPVLVLTVLSYAVMIPLCKIGKERIHVKNAQNDGFQAIWKYLKGNRYLLIFYRHFVLTACLPC